MPEYKRWISYIYYYENNSKRNNIGYIRVETKGAGTKLTMHINVLSVTEPMDVYLFVRDNSVMKGIKIGIITMDKGVGHGVYNISTSDIMGTGHGIEDIGGVILIHSDDKFYASEWDDETIDISRFEKYRITEDGTEDDRAPEDDGETTGGEPPCEEKDGGMASYETQDDDTDNMDMTGGDMHIPDDINEEDDYRVSVEDYRMQDEYTERQNSTFHANGSYDKTEEIKAAAEKMLKTYPYMYPFEDDEIDECVKIEPQDISNLPIDTWLIANNSFLLKGYYGYRHLIFIKIGMEHPKYMIGVPGINHSRENFLAGMFGFRLFKPIRNTTEVKGEFGYWCISIDNNK